LTNATEDGIDIHAPFRNFEHDILLAEFLHRALGVRGRKTRLLVDGLLDDHVKAHLTKKCRRRAAGRPVARYPESFRSAAALGLETGECSADLLGNRPGDEYTDDFELEGRLGHIHNGKPEVDFFKLPDTVSSPLDARNVLCELIEAFKAIPTR